MKNTDLISLLLPEEIVEYFDIIRIEKPPEHFIIELDEKNNPPKLDLGEKLISKGFYEPVTIQDFPLRGRACYLMVRKRRWTLESTGEIISNNWKLSAEGTRMTNEFAIFLKGINR